MAIDTEIEGVDIHGVKTTVKVTRLGQLVTGSLKYDEVVALTADVINTGYNFYLPKAHQQFVVTTILLTADSNVTGSTLIDIYEASAVDSITIDKSILHVEILKNGSRDIIGLNLLIAEGKYLNVKVDDDDVFVTIMGYYVPAFENGV